MTLEERFKEDVRLVGNIKWRSAEKDNMEFETKLSCYQLDALKRLIQRAEDDFRDRYE